jgi:NAD-dependent deacetylase
LRLLLIQFSIELMMKKKLVVLSGAGVSAESGVPTFRDANGLWEGNRIEDVASPEGWKKNKQLVLDFYNQRRKNMLEVQPNEAHYLLASLEEYFDVHIVTQNIDNLHERAGSTKVLHLHGEIFKVRSTVDEDLVYDITRINPNGWELRIGDKCEKGSQLRPYIVWFGEAVPLIIPAIDICEDADIGIVVGTSLVVYPAAGLVQHFPSKSPKFIIDPKKPEVANAKPNLHFIEEKATVGMQKVKELLLEKYL